MGAGHVVNGQTYTALEYLQFIQPGDLRVVTQGRSCGVCHQAHADCVNKSMLATSAGILSGAMFAAGIPNEIPESQGLYEDTAADKSFRAVTNPNFDGAANTVIGAVQRLIEFPVFSRFDGQGATDIANDNPFYDALLLAGDVDPTDGRVLPDSALANLYHEQVAFTCGDCHLGSAGANNRYGDFRSSGCTACHMRYALDGRSTSTDPRIEKLEPADPDQIAAPERAHVNRHVIQSVAQTLQSGETLQGIDDYTCAGCHQGSNRTVMQFWGIRLDQNEDLHNDVQYPANPATYTTTAKDTRLFDPVVNNNTFNGRNPRQYILEEDYDGDGRDDTPADVHYEAGMGCIDCHGSHDLHGGKVGDLTDADLLSRQEQGVAIRCESCHGGIDAPAPTVPCVTYDGLDAECAVDAEGNPLRHVTKDQNGELILVSRLTGATHYVKQTRDTIVDSGKVHPTTLDPIYNEFASYAMGRADTQDGGGNWIVDPNDTTGIGPLQDNPATVHAGFSHTDTMTCVSCHASWTNGCIGCHLGGEYDDRNNRFFASNITGERIVFNQANADFVYQTPVPFQLGIDARNKITQIAPNTETFFQYDDFKNDNSGIITFSDRNGKGSNPNTVGGGLPALSHNAMMPHSIRGRIRPDMEGPRYCVACHLTDEGLGNFATEYDDFRNDLAAQNFGNMPFNLLQEHIGENTGNDLNSPFWVHMVAGLGSGLFFFDEDGCPVNPLDTNPNRVGCDGESPFERFAAATPIYNLDRIVEADGTANSSSNHPMVDLADPNDSLRDGPNTNKNLSGPLGQTLLQKLADPNLGIILDSWIDSDAKLGGFADQYLTEREP